MNSTTTSDNAPCSIALVGYGSMGKEIERLASQYECAVRQIFTSKRPLESVVNTSNNEAFDFDVAIDFSVPDAALNNARILAAHGKHIIIGTTAWQAEESTMRMIIEQANVGAVWGTNFSVGVQMFAQIVRLAAKLANHYDEYDAALHELHHTHKLDSPSGTALTLAEIVRKELTRKTALLTDASHARIAPSTLHVSSTRVGATPGTHTLILDSAADTLELTHRARNRSGFASGALRAARWVQLRKGFFEFSEIFSTLHDL
jgi:4-hydroxy-tetrahydrodipicolinate reductase